jgi:hypothetical protein
MSIDLEEPRLQLVRCIPFGRGFRYLIAEGPESLEVYIRAFVDSCATFPRRYQLKLWIGVLDESAAYLPA